MRRAASAVPESGTAPTPDEDHGSREPARRRRQRAGPAAGLAINLNFNFEPAGLRRIAKALEPVGLSWLEMDLYDARALAGIRRSPTTPIGSMESIYGRRHCLPYFEEEAVDYAIIDVMWNGMSESVRMATMADTYHVNINSHSFSSPLGLLMGAQLCAVSPKFHYVEMDVDQVPWADDLFTGRLVIEQGHLVLPERPGWGLEVDEEAVRAHAYGIALDTRVAFRG